MKQDPCLEVVIPNSWDCQESFRLLWNQKYIVIIHVIINGSSNTIYKAIFGRIVSLRTARSTFRYIWDGKAHSGFS